MMRRGHCTSLRRTAVGPFDVAEAAAVEHVVLMPVGDVLARLPEEALARVEPRLRAKVLAAEARA